MVRLAQTPAFWSLRFRFSDPHVATVSDFLTVGFSPPRQPVTRVPYPVCRVPYPVCRLPFLTPNAYRPIPVFLPSGSQTPEGRRYASAHMRARAVFPRLAQRCDPIFAFGTARRKSLRDRWQQRHAFCSVGSSIANNCPNPRHEEHAVANRLRVRCRAASGPS